MVRGIRALAFAGTVFLTNIAPAASLYLQVPGITGEQSTPGYPGAMSIQSLSITPQHFSIVKNLDSASPAIATAVTNGTIFPSASDLLYNSAPIAAPDAILAFQNVIASAHTILGGGTTEQDSFVAANPLSMFLELPGITGASSTPGHPGVMQLDSFSLTPNQFSITKLVDSASPAIQLAVANGTLFATSSALFYNVSSPSGPPDGTFTFGNVIAISRQVLSGGNVPEEQDTFAFVSVPEPGTAALFVLGGFVSLLIRRKRLI